MPLVEQDILKFTPPLQSSPHKKCRVVLPKDLIDYCALWVFVTTKNV